MTKKIFAMFLAVLMVISVLPISAMAAEGACPGAGNDHTKSNCSYTEVKVTAPDCGNKGYTTYKCNKCGDTFVADWTNPVGEHTWVEAPYVAPTCEKAGSEGGKKCSVCGTVVDATVIPALGKDLKCEYSAWAPANIDCTTGGTQTRTCVHCGNKQEQKVDKVPGGHVLGDWELVTPATAEANGLAVKKCQNTNCNYKVEQVVFFDHNHDLSTLSPVAQADPDCDRAGVKAHYECRICGQKFVYGKANASATVDTFNAVTDADLVIKSKHAAILDTLDCMTTTYECGKCHKILKVDAAAAHKYPDWTVVTPATCVTDGFQKRTCTVCWTDSQTQIIPALGHIEGSWSVPATCTQYAYTYTYCLRQNCPSATLKTQETKKVNNVDVIFDLTLGSTVLTQPVVGAGFYLNLFNGNKNATYYFNGSVNSAERYYELGTTTDIANAAKVYLEEVKVEGVEHAYRMYFVNGSVKTYISIYKNGSYVNIKLDDAVPASYWTWNTQFGVLVTNVEGTDYWMGNYNNGTVFKANKLSYLEGENQWPAKMTVSNANGVQLLSLTVNGTAGFDSSNHNWKVLSEVPATCLADGVKISYCADGCGVANKTEILTKLADHDWDEGTVTKTPDCTNTGKKLFRCKCAGCSATKEEIIPAKGHDLVKENDQVKKFTHEGSHTDLVAYDYNKCSVCNAELNKTNYRAWENAGKIWDTKEAAEAAHGTLTAAASGSFAGSCTAVGYTAYTCAGCSEIVRVKIAGTGAHVFPTAGVTIEGVLYTSAKLDATCLLPGYSINYKCERCDKLVDESQPENKLTVIPAKGHSWKEFTAKERKDLGLGDYVKAPCAAPVYDNYIAYCSVCHPDGLTSLAGAVLKADTEKLAEETTAGPLCEAVVYELYKCHCGETHMRNFLSNIGHEWVEVNGSKVPATCTAEGHVDKVCKYCSADAPAAEEVLPLIPHKNAAGEEFTNSCLDDEKVTDRHCVNCCAHKGQKDHDCTADQDKNTAGVQTCPCVIAKEQHQWSGVKYVNSICGELPYAGKICSVCFKTEAEDAEQYVNEDGKLVNIPVNNLGHKPVAADADKYGQYTYVKDYKHYTYQWVDVTDANGQPAKELRQFVETYEAKFIAYTAPTYISNGYAKFECADCGQIIETEVAKLAGVGVKLNAYNANGASVDATLGSLIAVDVTLNSLNTGIYGFSMNVEVPTGTTYVGFELKNDDFIIITTNPDKVVNDEVKIEGFAANNAEGKMQNIVVAENTLMVTLFFRVTKDMNATIEFKAPAAKAFDLENFNKGEAGKIFLSDAATSIKSFKIGNFNRDEYFHVTDIYTAMTMLTGENSKTYDVTVDIDKDGEITLQDLINLYDYLVGNCEEADLLLKGVSADEAEFLKDQLKLREYKCSSPTCTYSSDVAFKKCPKCGEER